MSKLILQIILALMEAFKEYQKNERLLAQAKKNAEAMDNIDATFEGDGDAKTLNDIFMHKLNDRMSKSGKSTDKLSG